MNHFYLFTIAIVYIIGNILAFKGLKSALSNNGNDEWTGGMQIFTLLVSFSSWLGYFATTDKFIKWAEESEKGKKIIK